MITSRVKVAAVALLVVVLALCAWMVVDRRSTAASDGTAGETQPGSKRIGDAGSNLDGRNRMIADAEGEATPTAANDDGDEEEPKTAEELKADAEEAAVDAFDDLTDKWMEPSEKGVSMAEVSAFVAQFAKVPKDRKEECLQRALNLIPDANVMLLAGILMDKSQPKELMELVFNDVLNRDDSVKQPIFEAILKDESHPCREDVVWLRDATAGKSEK